MKENTIHFILSFIAKNFDDEAFISLIANCKDGFWNVEYNDGDKADFDVNKLEKGMQLYNYAKKWIFIYRQTMK